MSASGEDEAAQEALLEALPNGAAKNQFAYLPMSARQGNELAFKNYIRETGTLDFWRQAGFPPQCRSLGNDDFICD